MNNLLDYSHMIKTYVMKINYNTQSKNDNHPMNTNVLMQLDCKCDQYIFCYNSSNINKCKHYNMIINNLPLLKILINKNTKKQFKLPKEWFNSNLTSDEFIKIVLYMVNFADESIDYIMNKPNIKSIISLSMYILFINNYNIIQNAMYILEPLIINLHKKLKFYLSDEESITKLNLVFKKYFLEKPENCINTMNNWIIMFDNIINKS
jgi:hypothetical protein